MKLAVPSLISVTLLLHVSLARAEKPKPRSEWLPAITEEIPGRWRVRGRLVRVDSAGASSAVVGGEVRLMGHPRRNLDRRPPLQQTVTNAEGEFVVGGIPGGIWVRMEIDVDGCALRTLSGKLREIEEAGDIQVGDLNVEPGREVVVEVLGPRGEAVKSAQVLIGRRKTHRSRALERSRFTESRRDAVELGEGRYRLDRAPPGDLRVQVIAPGYQRSREYYLVPIRGPILVFVDPAYRFEGRLRDEDGVAIAGATIELDGPNIGDPPPTVRSNETGEFLFDILGSGSYSMKVVADGFTTQTFTNLSGFDSSTNGPRIWVLKDGAVVRGIVSDDSGRVLSGALVTARSGGDEMTKSVTTGSDGRFLVDALPVGKCEVLIDHPEFAPALLPGPILRAAEVRDLMPKALSKGQRLVGRLIDAESERPIPGARVYARATFGTPSGAGLSMRPRISETDRDGRFDLRALPDLTVDLTFLAKDHLTETRSWVVGSRDELRVKLRRGSVIAGRISESSGRPLSGALLRLTWSRPVVTTTPEPAQATSTTTRRTVSTSTTTQETVRSIVSDSKGRYRFSGLSDEGSYSLEIEKRDFASEERHDLRPAKHDLTSLHVLLARSSTIRGRITDVDGQAVAGAEIYATTVVTLPSVVAPTALSREGSVRTTSARSKTYRSEETRSDANGNYVITGLRGGSHTIYFNTKGRFLTHVEVGVNVLASTVRTGVNLQLSRGETLRGVVVDLNGQPVAGAELRFVGGGTPVVYSDAKGQFVATTLPPGTVSVKVTKKGFQALQQPVTLSAGDARLVLSPPTVRNAAVPRGVIIDGSIRTGVGPGDSAVLEIPPKGGTRPIRK